MHLLSRLPCCLLLFPFLTVSGHLDAQRSSRPSAPLAAPLAALGLPLPSRGNLPYALDHFGGKPVLTPIHHSAVELNQHRGANIAGSLAGSFFYKPKMSVEVAGLHARSIVHDRQPSFFLRLNEDADDGGDPNGSLAATWSLVRAVIDKDRRIFTKIQFTQLTGNAKRTGDGIIAVTEEHLPGGWLKLTPAAPLEPGEYAVQPVLKDAKVFSMIVFDFAIDPAAPKSADAIEADPDDEDSQPPHTMKLRAR